MSTKLKKKVKPNASSEIGARHLSPHLSSAKKIEDWELEVLGIPLEVGAPFPELSESQRILFQRCCEIYRVSEHFIRKRELMFNVFSQYRTRTQFETALRTHYFETDERLSALMDPEFYAIVLGVYHFIRSLSLSLTHTESQPTALLQELIWAEAHLVKSWDRISQMAFHKFGWKFRKLS